MKTLITIVLALVMGIMPTFGQEASETMMKVYTRDGKTTRISLSEIKKITFAEKQQPVAAGKAIDLGLPSGTLWADRNIGAETSEASGSYYAWGDCEEQEDYSWENYNLWDEAGNQFVVLTPDTLSIQNTDFDVAKAQWGGDWVIPSKKQFTELQKLCTWTWVKDDARAGYEVKGPNGNRIFLPANGAKFDVRHLYEGTLGNYWSADRIQQKDYEYLSWVLWFAPDEVDAGANAYRYYGFAIRPVICAQEGDGSSAN